MLATATPQAVAMISVMPRPIELEMLGCSWMVVDWSSSGASAISLNLSPFRRACCYDRLDDRTGAMTPIVPAVST
jgi:hypothetical protein